MALRGLAADFDAQYGYRPWLVESFVDTEQFLGTCYQAANLVAVGQSQARGRQDRGHEHAKSVKTIYVYVLQQDFRSRMGVAQPLGPVALQPGEGSHMVIPVPRQSTRPKKSKQQPRSGHPQRMAQVQGAVALSRGRASQCVS